MLANRILAALPQTQCQRCGFPDCEGYANAIASGLADINQCPPGGAQGVERLAVITGRPIMSLNPANGVESTRTLAVIDENWCIGCTLCIEACPTDAIFGSNKLMHTVIEPYCTGCELCVPVCPVDCIQLKSVSAEATGWDAWSGAQADLARSRYERHTQRLHVCSSASPSAGPGEQISVDATSDAPVRTPGDTSQTTASASDKKSEMIKAAMLRARTNRQLNLPSNQPPKLVSSQD